MPPRHRITASPRHRVICLAPCHQTSQSFDLPPATKPVSHLTCPVPPCHRVTASPRHCVICLAPCHQTSQSFALPPATKPVSHLTCPVPPRHRVICLAPCHQTSQSFALPPATKPVSHLTCPVPPRHRVTTPPRHRATASPRHLPCPLPPNQSVICLAPCHQTSQSFDLPPTTASPRHRVTTSDFPHHMGYESDWLMLTSTVLICKLPPATANQIISAFSYLITIYHQSPCPLHHVTASPRHRITASPRHRVRFSPPHGYESDWLMLTSTFLIG